MYPSVGWVLSMLSFSLPDLCEIFFGSGAKVSSSSRRLLAKMGRLEQRSCKARVAAA